MRTYILVLIIVFSFILFNHLLPVREGLACLDQSSMASFNQNSNTITTDQILVAKFLSDVDAAEAAVANNTAMLLSNWQHNNQLKTAVCPDKCPSIDHGDGSDHTYVCAVGCCDLDVRKLGDKCVNPFVLKKFDADKKGDSETAFSIPDPSAKAAGVQQAPPSQKAISAV